MNKGLERRARGLVANSTIDFNSEELEEIEEYKEESTEIRPLRRS